MTPDSMDNVFQALGHPSRRRMLDLLKHRPGSNVNDICRHFDVSRIAVMKHLNVLEAAGLVTSEKVGRSRRLSLNVVPIQMIYDRWTSEYSALWAEGLARLKYRVEADAQARATGRRRSTRGKSTPTGKARA